MVEFAPWEKYPSLTSDRLVVIASAIKEARHSAVLNHEPSKGDNIWTLGCVAYKRSCFAIVSIEPSYDWLKILPEDQNRFIFSVGAVPLKFYRGMAEDPPNRSLAVSFTELCSIQYCFDFGVVPDGKHILRLAVETDAAGEVKRVILVELDGGNVANLYTVPLGSDVSSVLPMQTKAIDVGPPELKTMEEEEADRRKTESGADRKRNAG
jgi:hypothetical protein